MECNERVLSFVAEWFDPHPQIIKRYLLKYHWNGRGGAGGGADVEMRDMQTKRVFLKRTKVPPTLLESDFVVGANILLLSRDLKLVEYADSATRELLESDDERTVLVLPPSLYESLGDVVALVETAGLTLVDLKSTCLTAADASEAASLLQVDAEELRGLLVAMSFRGANSIAAVNELVQSSSFAGLGLVCAGNADEALAYQNFFLNRQLPTTATFEECTCCVIKPHAVKERNVGAIFQDIVARGFVVSAVAMFQMERASAAEFLEVYDGVVPEYSQMVDEMCSSSVVAMEVRLKPDFTSRDRDSSSCVEEFRAHTGPWDVGMAKELHPDTLRGKFGRDRIRNAIHATDLPKDGLVEVQYFFSILSSKHYVDGWK